MIITPFTKIAMKIALKRKQQKYEDKLETINLQLKELSMNNN